MRRPSWEVFAGALATLLNGSSNRQLMVHDLYTIVTPGGLTLRYTNAQLPITLNGNTWSTGPNIKRGRTRLQVGIEVDSLDMTLTADASVTVNAMPLVQFIARRGLDDGRLTLERAFSPGPGQAYVGTLELFLGRIAIVQGVSRSEARITVNSDTELFDVMVPRNTYQPPCMNTVFDSACGLSRVANTTASTAASATDATRVYFAHSLAAAAGYYDLGAVRFTSGANAGIARTVRKYETVAGSGVNRITLMSALPAPAASGDAFEITRGCPRTKQACSDRANLSRFRGTPYIPTPESIL